MGISESVIMGMSESVIMGISESVIRFRLNATLAHVHAITCTQFQKDRQTDRQTDRSAL